MGAFLRVKTKIISLAELVEKFPKTNILGAALEGESIFEKEFQAPAIIVIGNESMGISQVTESYITEKIRIPKPPNGGAESLNAAVATGIICAFMHADR